MWSKLDDELFDHQKIFTAGELIGGKAKNGPAVALGFYAAVLMWASKHLSDGHLPSAVIRNLPHVGNPLAIADALVQAGLLEKNGSGFQIHDFEDFNPSAARVKAKRRRDKLRKRREREEKDGES